MSTRAETLAQRIEQGANGLAAFAEGLTEAQWNTIVPPDGRAVGVIIHHVASVYPVEVHVATEMAAGKPIEGLTWDAIAEMNAGHAKENKTAGKKETIDLLRNNSRAAAESIRNFTDEQLDRAVLVSLYGDAPLTAQFFVEDHALRHSWHHLAKIKKVLAQA
jgi:hypothetical protein